MGEYRTNVRNRLMAMADEEYRSFHASLVPGTGSEQILGVRLPNMRKLAKELAKEDFRRYLRECLEEENEEKPFYEERMIEGLVIGYGKMEVEEQLQWLRTFVPKIDNWAVCDCCCATYKFMQKNPRVCWDFLEGYLNSDREFEVRFALVSMLDHFVKEEYVDRILQAVEGVKQDGYYVKMAAAWLISVLFVHFPEKTEALLERNTLDDFTHNKAIQKIRESYRVSKEDKERLNKRKRSRKQ